MSAVDHQVDNASRMAIMFQHCQIAIAILSQIGSSPGQHETIIQSCLFTVEKMYSRPGCVTVKCLPNRHPCVHPWHLKFYATSVLSYY